MFPDARVVWLHRDPVTAVTSHCSLVAVLRAIGTDHVDPHSIGREWPLTWERVLERAVTSRSRLGDDRFIDVRYEDLLADSVGTIRDLYWQLGTALEPNVEAQVREYLGTHPQWARGTHDYSPADFGLDENALRDRFSAYTARFPNGVGRG